LFFLKKQVSKRGKKRGEKSQRSTLKNSPLFFPLFKTPSHYKKVGFPARGTVKKGGSALEILPFYGDLSFLKRGRKKSTLKNSPLFF
jgi:hypothetical protein